MTGMPPPPPRPPNTQGDLRRSVLAAGAWRQGGGGAQEVPPAAPRDPALLLPLPWSPYFDRQLQVACPERQATFNVYTAGTAGPVVFCLHGGGYTGLSWSLLAQQLKGRCRVVAADLRCHGQTEAADEADFSAATLAADVAAIWAAMFGGGAGGQERDGVGQAPGQQPAQQQQQGGPPPTVLVGHSMGGAVAVHAAALAAIPSLAGIVVIDVVEGTAIASLPYMSGVLAKRPQRFVSLQQAVDWALDTGMCKRQDAAHLSLPSMLLRLPGAGEEGPEGGEAPAPPLTASGLEPLAEEGDGEEDGEAEAAAGRRQPPAAACGAPDGSSRDGETRQAGGWAWRTPLERSAPFWEGWYSGLSELFLGLPVPKVLVLVGTDRLDRPLTIGQMQGKFQPVLLPQAGHAVHEDEPERVAEAIATFIKRFRIGEPPLQVPRPAAGLQPVLPQAIGPAFAARPHRPAQ